MSIIPATQADEAGEPQVQHQLGKHSKTPRQKRGWGVYLIPCICLRKHSDNVRQQSRQQEKNIPR